MDIDLAFEPPDTPAVGRIRHLSLPRRPHAKFTECSAFENVFSQAQETMQATHRTTK
jgi:hypothetical protein